MSNELVEQLTKEKQAQNEVINELHSKLEAYQQLGTPEELEEVMSKSEEITNKLDGINIDTVKESMDKLKKYEEIGSVEEIDKAIEESKKIISDYVELGSVQDIDEAISKSKEMLTAYKDLGTPEEIDEALGVLQAKVVNDRCESIAARFNVKTDTVSKMYESVKNFDAIETLLNDGFGSDKKSSKMSENKDKTSSKDKKEVAGFNESSFLRRSAKTL